MSSSNPLPQQEANLFKKVLKCYEQKQYKKGLQHVKEILKKFPEHGETLSMKGLILNCTNKKAEAYECAQRGLKYDLKSHVCWHVYGLLQRSDRKYDEAIKCYRNALRCDKSNLQILRDLSLLQIQIRDLDGYRDTRYQLFQLRPTQRTSWIGYAMAYHLLNEHETANNILDEFAKTQQPKQYDYEHSEFLLYQNMILRDGRLYNQALEHITEFEANIVDKLAVEEIKAECQLNLKNFDKLEKIYVDLIDRNPDNLSYYKKLEEIKSFQTTEERHAFYIQFQDKFPRSDLPRKIPLEFLDGDEFKKTVDKYLKRALRKGVPPLFKEVRLIYKDAQKLSIVEQLCLQYVESLENERTFSSDSQEIEAPTTLLWVYYYLAQHYDYLRDSTNALKYINQAIQHTPTLVELYIVKGKIYKHAGNFYSAVKWLDEAQSLDTADRFINYKCSKYMLRADMIKEAQEIAAKFTREGVSAFDYLKEMQCMWFETECANAYHRLGNYGEALKKCHQVERHFQEIIEDQFDFHSYCMRKMTLRSYVEMLRLEDHIRSQPFFFAAAQTAIEIYIQLNDKPLSDNECDTLENTENLTASELKKLKNKQKKQQIKAQQEKEKLLQLEQKKKEINKQKSKEDGEAIEALNEDDLVPEKLERPEKPLDECSKFLKPLEEFASDRIRTHVLAFEVYLRKGRFLLMLRSVRKMKNIDAQSPEFHYYLCKFLIKYNFEKTLLSETIKQVIEKELSELYGGESIETLNEAFLKANEKNYGRTVHGAQVLYELNPSENAQRAINIVTNLDDFSSGIDLMSYIKVFRILKDNTFGKTDSSVLESYKAKCHERWPFANVFQSKEEVDQELATCFNQSVIINENGSDSAASTSATANENN